MGLGSTSLMPRKRDIKESYEHHAGQNSDRDHEFGEMWGKKMPSVLGEMCLQREIVVESVQVLEKPTVWLSLCEENTQHAHRNVKTSPRTKDEENKYHEIRETH